MALRLMYITDNTEVAKIADKHGVDRIFVDMEYIGKEDRQRGLDCVKLHHTLDDVARIRKAVSNAEVLVRINPIHDATAEYSNTEDEVLSAIDAGADVIMLPMYRTVSDVHRLLNAVNGKCKVMLLAETPQACEIMPEVVRIPEVDEIHIGLNDLHLAYKKHFMFELLTDGTVEKLCRIMKDAGKQYGFGGIARIKHGLLPAEYVIREHYRLGSGSAILSRSFCNVDRCESLEEIERLFSIELKKIREEEQFAAKMTEKEYVQNSREIENFVERIVSGIKDERNG